MNRYRDAFWAGFRTGIKAGLIGGVLALFFWSLDAHACRATWYGSESGSRTATGERFNPAGMTAAHRGLPLNSFARVTNTANGAAVVVRINDRGPAAYTGNCIDLAQGAARAIGMRGTANVIIEPAEGPLYDAASSLERAVQFVAGDRPLRYGRQRHVYLPLGAERKRAHHHHGRAHKHRRGRQHGHA